MSGPANDSTASYIGDDGRWVHTIRQSTLSKYVQMCAESVRADISGEAVQTTSSAAAIGTSVHAAIEYVINDVIRDGHGSSDFDAAILHAMTTYNDIAAAPNFFDDHGAQKAGDLIHGAFKKWTQQVLPKLHPVASELTFKGLVLHEDEQRIILLNGTMDYIDQQWGACDWKTASRAYSGWEKQRWDIQSSCYLWALGQLGIEAPPQFTFVVMIHGKPEVQWLTVKRDHTHSLWFHQQAFQYALMCESNMPTWPLRDSGWWCSKKFCGVYERCRGTWGDHTA